MKPNGMQFQFEEVPYEGALHVRLYDLQRPSLWIARPLIMDIKRITDSGVFEPPSEPMMRITDKSQLLSMYNSFKSEMERLGFIRPEPNEIEIERLRDELLDCRKIRDTLARTIEKIHSLDNEKTLDLDQALREK